MRAACRGAGGVRILAHGCTAGAPAFEGGRRRGWPGVLAAAARRRGGSCSSLMVAPAPEN